MKKIRQQVETSFVGIELKDAVIMAPIMDELARVVKTNEEFRLNSLCAEPKMAEKIFNVLAEIGFVCTNGTNDIHELD